MKTTNSSQRRQFLKMGGAALAIIPILAISGRANAATNASMRTALKYQATPSGDKSCSTCAQFVAPSSCKIIPNDTEISPKGYCTAWTKKA